MTSVDLDCDALLLQYNCNDSVEYKDMAYYYATQPPYSVIFSQYYKWVLTPTIETKMVTS